jgi:hypothetical protein
MNQEPTTLLDTIAAYDREGREGRGSSTSTATWVRPPGLAIGSLVLLASCDTASSMLIGGLLSTTALVGVIGWLLGLDSGERRQQAGRTLVGGAGRSDGSGHLIAAMASGSSSGSWGGGNGDGGATDGAGRAGADAGAGWGGAGGGAADGGGGAGGGADAGAGCGGADGGGGGCG